MGQLGTQVSHVGEVEAVEAADNRGVEGVKGVKEAGGWGEEQGCEKVEAKGLQVWGQRGTKQKDATQIVEALDITEVWPIEL